MMPSDHTKDKGWCQVWFSSDNILTMLCKVQVTDKCQLDIPVHIKASLYPSLTGWHWETHQSYQDSPHDLAIPPIHCFILGHSTLRSWWLVLCTVRDRKQWTPHSSLTIVEITKIHLGVYLQHLHIQLNFGCLSKGHAWVWSNQAELVTLVWALSQCWKKSRQ